VGFVEVRFLPLAVVEEVLPDLGGVFCVEDFLVVLLFVVDDFWSSGVNECADGVKPTSRELDRTAI
jgi:hypothetical protein